MNSDVNYISHIPVFFNEIINHFGPSVEGSEDAIMADLTFGGGGHTFGLLNKFPKLKIVATDQDPAAIKSGQNRIKEEKLEDRIELIKTNFVNFPNLVKNGEVKFLGQDVKLKGILLDLGVSTHQLTSKERGFSFRSNAFLDMRMDYENDEIMTASEVLNTFSEEDLNAILLNYGEEYFSKRIVHNIIEFRKQKLIETAAELESIVFQSYPANKRHGKAHPATKTFQALRIFVNSELKVVEDVIPQLFDLLAENGKLGIISFHSLEDRIVKHLFKKINNDNKETSQILTKRPIVPTDEEVFNNPRARSAKLRFLAKVDQGEIYDTWKKKRRK